MLELDNTPPKNDNDPSNNIELFLLAAKQENITLTEQHFIIIKLLHNFYNKYQIVPSTRALINYVKEQKPEILLDSLLFNQLFPQGIAQACRIARLPKSPRCL